MINAIKRFVIVLMSFILVFSLGMNSNVLAADTVWKDFIQNPKNDSTTDRNKEWTVTFSQLVDESTVTKENVRVTKLDGTSVEVLTKVNGKTIKVTPTLSYEVGQSYILYVGPGIKSLGNKDLKSNIKFKFSVEQEVSIPEQPHTIEMVSDDGVLIDGDMYTVGSEVRGLFQLANATVLIGAKIIFTSEGSVLKDIKELHLTSDSGTVNKPTLVDGGGARIAGSVFIEGDNYELNNLTIHGDLTISEKVLNGFTANHVNVNGKVFTTDKLHSSNQKMRMMTADSLPSTRMKITFNDSTIVYIDISKEDMYLVATGSTTITAIAIKANSDIFANENIILPDVHIFKGVTRVDLNATIKDIEIDSNDDIEVTGSGDFSNVTVNTDKNVTFNTTGTIANLKTNHETGTLTLGDKLAVKNLDLPIGKKAEDVVNNFGSVKDKIEKIEGVENPGYNPETKPEVTPDGYFAAGIVNSENRFGYGKINIKNLGNHRVLYQELKRFTSTPDLIGQVGGKVPAGAIDYKLTSEIPLYWNKNFVVYQVDTQGIVVDMKKITRVNNIFPKLEFDGETVTMTTLLDSEDAKELSTTSYLYMVTESSVQLITDLTKGSWSQIDGLNAVTLNLQQSVANGEAGEYIMIFNNNGFYSGNNVTENMYIRSLLFISKTNHKQLSGEIHSALRALTCGTFLESPTFNEKCNQSYFGGLYEKDSLSIATYKEEFIKQESTINSAEQVNSIIKQVDSRLYAIVSDFKKTKTLVEGLYKEDRYDYPWEESFKIGLTQVDIDNASEVVALLDDRFVEKIEYLNDISNAQYYLEQKQNGVN